MEKFYFEVPTIERKDEAIAFIREFYEYNSNINGTGGLQRFLDNYEGWLEKLEEDYNRVPSEEKVPATTYFFIRQSDNKIIGMLNLRLALNEELRNGAGNIGYCIRPTERKKGYNKINLFLGLLKAQEYKIDEVLLDADLDNPGSWKTIEALGGELTKEEFSEEDGCVVKYYKINTIASIAKNKSLYEEYISEESIKR